MTAAPTRPAARRVDLSIAIRTGSVPAPPRREGSLGVARPGLAILLVAGIAAGHRGRTG